MPFVVRAGKTTSSVMRDRLENTKLQFSFLAGSRLGEELVKMGKGKDNNVVITGIGGGRPSDPKQGTPSIIMVPYTQLETFFRTVTRLCALPGVLPLPDEVMATARAITSQIAKEQSAPQESPICGATVGFASRSSVPAPTSGAMAEAAVTAALEEAPTSARSRS